MSAFKQLTSQRSHTLNLKNYRFLFPDNRFTTKLSHANDNFSPLFHSICCFTENKEENVRENRIYTLKNKRRVEKERKITFTHKRKGVPSKNAIIT